MPLDQGKTTEIQGELMDQHRLEACIGQTWLELWAAFALMF